MSFRTDAYYGVKPSSTADYIAIDSLDVSQYDKFSMQFQNSSTIGNISAIVVEAAIDPTTADSALREAPNWVQLSTNTLPQPDLLAAGASTMTSAVDNAYHRLRIKMSVTASDSKQVLTVRLSGHTITRS